MKKWEYKVEDTSLSLAEDVLNKLGKEGWELVGITKGSKAGETVMSYGDASSITLVLKREVVHGEFLGH